jgi:hypothetical protein
LRRAATRALSSPSNPIPRGRVGRGAQVVFAPSHYSAPHPFIGDYALNKHVPGEHLPLYLAEIDYKYNTRKITDGARTVQEPSDGGREAPDAATDEDAAESGGSALATFGVDATDVPSAKGHFPVPVDLVTVAALCALGGFYYLLPSSYKQEVLVPQASVLKPLMHEECHQFGSPKYIAQLGRSGDPGISRDDGPSFSADVRDPLLVFRCLPFREVFNLLKMDRFKLKPARD